MSKVLGGFVMSATQPGHIFRSTKLKFVFRFETNFNFVLLKRITFWRINNVSKILTVRSHEQLKSSGLVFLKKLPVVSQSEFKIFLELDRGG